jgi:hypothetical protein
LESQDEESEDFVEEVPHQNNPKIKSKQSIKEQKNLKNTVKGKEASLGGNASLHGNDPYPIPVDMNPIGVYVSPLDSSVGVEKGDAWEGEPKSPSFAEILKKNPCPSPPLTRERKENKNRKDKEEALGNSRGS